VETKKDNKRKRQAAEHLQQNKIISAQEEHKYQDIEKCKENKHESEQEGSNSDDGKALESKQDAQSSAVSTQTKNIRKQVKHALTTLSLTQKALSTRLDISPAKISQWLSNKNKVAEPEVVLTQMISFLAEEEMIIRAMINTGSSTEHAKYRKESSSPSSSRRKPQPTTFQRPKAGATTTPPPPAMTTIPNAPLADTSSTSLNNEPGLQGGYANGRGGKSIDQVNMNQDMNAMPDNGLI
jgi:hypothetical protein